MVIIYVSIWSVFYGVFNLMTNNKLALLVIAHGNIEELICVLKRMESDEIYFFIHIDKKIYLDDSVIKRLLVIKNCNLARKRITVNWGGRSQVDAMLSLLNDAYEFDVDFDFYGFISGSDFPVATSEKIQSFFCFSKNDYIRIDRKITKQNDDRITNLNLHDIGFLNHRNHKGVFSKFLRLLLGVLRRVRIRRWRDNFTFVHGSSWMFLKRGTVSDILTFISLNDWYYKLFKYSFGADEIFFHSIIFNLKIEIKQDFTNCALESKLKDKLYGVHYIDWDVYGKNFNNKLIGAPKDISIHDVPKISEYLRRGALFVRKVDYRNKELLSLLDEITMNSNET